jgi:rubredoxin-NAD+ reductase
MIDLAQWPLSRLLPEAGGALLCERLAAVGVRFHAGCSASSVNCAGQGYCLELSNNQRIETDVVLSAIGLRPRIQLAQAAELAVGRGVVVDGKLQASAADIYALGDCAEVCGQVLPFVMPIMQAARALAATLAGNPTAVRYPAMPVVVKTPACPTTVCPPPAASSGNWQIETPAAGLKALFCDASGKPLGFALLDAANAEKQALTAQMPAWLEAR